MHIFDGDMEGFALPTEGLDPNLRMTDIIDIIESMKNILERMEARIVHELLIVDHDDEEELNHYFARWTELSAEERTEWWNPQRLRTVFAVRDAAEYICQRFLEAAGADVGGLDVSD